MTTRPHDALFKAAFEDPAHAAALLRELLPGAVSSAIAWDSMTLQVGSFVDPELADRHTDLLFSVQLHGDRGEALLYLLLEHQSENDPDMPLRVLVYEVRIWERFRKEHRGVPLPPIIPVVVSHVSSGWTAPRSFEAMFDPNVISIPGLAELVPRFSLLIEDLARRSNEDLKAWALEAYQKLVLWALRDGRHADLFLGNLGDWVAPFNEAKRAPRGIQAIAQLLRYFALVTDDLQLETFRAKIREQLPETEEIAMTTIAEQMRREGRAEGHTEGHTAGHTAGRIDALRKLLVLKFGAIDAEHDARIKAASSESLDRYLERILTATTLAGVFAD